MNMDFHIAEIIKLRKFADAQNDDIPSGLITKIDSLAKCLVYIGRLSSVLDGDYKRIYAKRKYEFALAVTKATKDKQAHAEIAVTELRQAEAESYELMNRWRNAFTSTTEEIHSLKMRMRMDVADGTQSSQSIQSSQQGKSAS